MFGLLARRTADMRLLKALLEGAERYALSTGEQAPGAAHILAAACDLPDGSARRAFERAGLDAAQYKADLRGRHSETLRAHGLPATTAILADEGPAPPPRPIFDAAPSGQEVVRRLAETRSARRGRGMTAADVVAAIAQAPDRLVLQLLRRADIDPEALLSAARLEADTAAQASQTAKAL